jgi:hypothetical protein
MDNPRTAALSRADERGIALILALLFTMVVSGLTLTGTLLLRSHIQKNRTTFATKSQALQVARSGLAEGLSWLRRQTSQPVLTFAPQLNPTAPTPILDTIDPDIGLVREFKITGKTWARYELWKEWAADPDPVRAAWRAQYTCEDVSEPRSQATAGSVWRLRSIGYIYNKLDDTKPFNVAPNGVVASQVAVNEVRRMVVTLPGVAAVNVADGNSCHINTNGRIVGGTATGIYYGGSPTPGPTTGPASAARVTGMPPMASAMEYDDSYEAIFGSTYSDLVAMATLVITNEADIPNPLPEAGLIIIDIGTTLQFDSSNPLVGTALVIVKGSTTLLPGNNSNFSGLLYVEGNLTVRAPCEINGSVICTGNMSVQGASDYATITFDDGVLNELMNRLGNYRPGNTTWLPRVAR